MIESKEDFINQLQKDIVNKSKKQLVIPIEKKLFSLGEEIHKLDLLYGDNPKYQEKLNNIKKSFHNIIYLLSKGKENIPRDKKIDVNRMYGYVSRYKE